MYKVTDYDAMIVAKTTIKKRWFGIIVSGIIFAIIFCSYKEYKGDYVIQSEDILIGKQIQLVDYTDRQDRIRLDGLTRTRTVLYDFYIESKEQFNYLQMIPGWGNKSDSQKIDWLEKHIKVNDYGAGNLEMRFDIMKTEAKDLAYLKENGEKYINSYVEFLKSKNIITTYKTNAEMAVFSTTEIINKKDVLIKYGLIGFILGSVFMFTIYLIKELRR